MEKASGGGGDKIPALLLLLVIQPKARTSRLLEAASSLSFPDVISRAGICRGRFNTKLLFLSSIRNTERNQTFAAEALELNHRKPTNSARDLFQ